MADSKKTGSCKVNVVNQKDMCLKAHNTLHALHEGTPALEWDTQLQNEAQQWAKHLAEENTFSHCKDRNGAGENIFCGTGKDAVSGAKATLSWYDEFKKYDFNSEDVKPGTGHFTQVVWKSSAKLGVGIAVREEGNMKKTFVVARYKPAGNMRMPGEYKKNVQPRKTKAETPSLKDLDPEAK